MKGWLIFASYIGTIFAANWAVATLGIVPVWPWPLLMAPAAVYFVGLAFPLRDGLQREKGRRWGFAAILIGSALSALVSPHFAFASGVTFLISEGTDMLIYTPLARRFALAVTLSSVAALVVDSIIFLWLAFGSEQFLFGQIIGKLWMTAFAVVLIKTWSRFEVLSRNSSSKLARDFPATPVR